MKQPCWDYVTVDPEHKHVLAIAGPARAEDKANPTGTWKYTVDVNGQSIEVTIKLKLEGDGHRVRF